MKLRLLAVGTKMPGWVQQGFADYQQRFPPDMPLELLEIPAGKRGKNADIQRIIDKEGELLLAQAPRQHIITLDLSGKPWSSEQLAGQLQSWQQAGRDVCLLTGGPEGLSVACKAAAHQNWSLSPLTLPHPLVRIVVAESLYRAWSILNHHPYHRQ